MEQARGFLHRHEELKRRILAHPELVGVERKDIIYIQTEYALKIKKQVIARPDVVIFYKCAQGICKKFIEVKSGSCHYARQDLHVQLRKIERYLRYKHIDGEVLGVYPEEKRLAVVSLLLHKF